MGRIKINDLPEDHKINKEEMRKVLGGTFVSFGSMLYTRPTVHLKPASIGSLAAAAAGIGPISIS